MDILTAPLRGARWGIITSPRALSHTAINA